MAINTDGQKKLGRFIKKDSKLLSSVEMVNYNFNEIGASQPVAYDNPDRNIINARFHDPEEIAANVKKPPSMDSLLEDVNKPRLGLILPADFTQDWYNERSNKKKKKQNIDDDEDDIDHAALARSRSRTNFQHQSPGSGTSPGSSDYSELGVQNSPESQHVAARPISPEVVRSSESPGAEKFMTEEVMSSAINKAFIKPPLPDTARVGDQQKANNDSFTPLPTQSQSGPIAAEEQAIESWKLQQELARQNERLLEDLKAQARSDGYQAGFREGEEKGLLSGQKKAAQVFRKVEEIITEFDGLKSIVLDNVQKNFYELSQAIGEALLGREFSIKPEAYATMIQRVIKDTIAPNEFKVKMHPETWQRVYDLGIPELSPHLVKDPSVAIGEFRVESKLTVVDVSAKKLVQQLLEKVDINLFEDKKVS
jgi:flagellar biosynthesis/type III secretory pathway protein FliH